MAATVYAPPEELPIPDFGNFRTEGGGFDVEGYFAACEEHRKQVAQWCREHTSSPDSNLVGEEMFFPVADGKAIYIVLSTRPLELIEVSDEYTLDDMTLRGMRVSDVRAEVNKRKKLDEIFGRSNRS